MSQAPTSEAPMSEATDPRVHLERALAQSAAVIAAVSPAQMQLPTACSEFDVRTLIGHMLMNVTNQAAIARREPPTIGRQYAVTGLADYEWAPTFEQRAKDAMSAWNAPDALQGEVTLPFATLPAAVAVGVNVLEQTTHAWDLAAATGSLSVLDPELAEVALTVAGRMVPPGPRGGELPFADAVDVPADAPAYDRLAGFLGRNPVQGQGSGSEEGGGTAALADERSDLLETLGQARFFLRFTARDLDDEQARRRTTVSELTVAGLIKHVTSVERGWAAFITQGPSAMSFEGESSVEAHQMGFQMGEDETLAGILDEYAAVAATTDDLVRTLPDLDASHPLPPAPWFKPGARWSARRVLLHIVAETAQHAGHADIIRESLDGAKTMG